MFGCSLKVGRTSTSTVPVYIFCSGHGKTSTSQIIVGFLLVQKNSAMAGAITGAALALTSDDSSHEQIVQSAITGAAISTAANLLKGIF